MKVKTAYLLFSLFLLSTLVVAQQSPLAVFDHLLHKTWSAEGTWGDGSKFRQEITFAYGLDSTLILTKAKGFTNPEQTQYGWRNHGIRKFDKASKSLKFWEFDVFGGVTEGEVFTKGKSIYYQYQYGDELVTDLWEYVNDTAYVFKVGSYSENEWKQIYLNTTFTTTAPNMKTTEEIPYAQIPEYPFEYNACTVTARMIDGLGFRYYWATKDLDEKTLAYAPSESGRTTAETIDHIYGLALMVWNSVNNRPNVRPAPELDFTFEEKRAATLELLKEASDILKITNPIEMENLKITFKRGAQESSVPFWHQLNGPLADALWHTGQIVVFRRAAGNPMEAGVNVFMGNVKQ